MKFITVEARPEGKVDSILSSMPTSNDKGNFDPEQEKAFIHELMDKTTDNLTVELEEHEELFIVVDTKLAFSISKNLPEQRIFNLGSYLKLLAPAQSAFTYYVVMDKKRTDSVSVKELMSKEHACCVRNGKPVCDIYANATVTVGVP